MILFKTILWFLKINVLIKSVVLTINIPNPHSYYKTNLVHFSRFWNGLISIFKGDMCYVVLRITLDLDVSFITSPFRIYKTQYGKNMNGIIPQVSPGRVFEGGTTISPVANEQQYDILTSIILILNCLRHSFLPRQPLGDQSCRPVLGADERHFTPLQSESRRPTYIRWPRIGMLSTGWRQYFFWAYITITLVLDKE